MQALEWVWGYRVSSLELMIRIQSGNTASTPVSSRDSHYNIRLSREALKRSDNNQTEQMMIEDKLKATDWEATDVAVAEQVARESYLQWLADQEKARPAGQELSYSHSFVKNFPFFVTAEAQRQFQHQHDDNDDDDVDNDDNDDDDDDDNDNDGDNDED